MSDTLQTRFSDPITTPEQLRDVLGFPSPIARDKVIDHIDSYCAEFIGSENRFWRVSLIMEMPYLSSPFHLTLLAHEPGFVALPGPVFVGLALVVHLFALGQSDLKLGDASVVEIEL